VLNQQRCRRRPHGQRGLEGVPLRQLLEEARPRANVRDVVFHGVDGYTDTFALAKAMDPTTLVAYEMNGQPCRCVTGSRSASSCPASTARRT